MITQRQRLLVLTGCCACLLIGTAVALPAAAADEQTNDAIAPVRENRRSTARIEGDSEQEASVGMACQVRQVVLPGPELEVRSVDPRTTPVIVRIDAVYPHGDSFRYDLTWFGLEPGHHDLSDYLSRKDGSPADELPSIPVTVSSVIQSGDPLPGFYDTRPRVRSGGYQLMFIAGIVVWVAGLIAILCIGRSRRSADVKGTEETPTDRIRQIEELLQRAMSTGFLTATEKAFLDARVVAFWRERRQLNHMTADAALRVLRQDSEASPLLQTLEQWLYRPPSDDREDLNSLLKPLRDAVHAARADTPASPGGTPAASVPSVATEEQV
ncbi:MAG: hypothetical protein KDA96_07760 [Planctomycetaceae bacterium]|nr:hypothetical protein [Planctomycetaceae bacterium]